MGSSLLALVSIGLITTYWVLVYSMRKYFREALKTERTRLSILFASFIVSYTFRLVFQTLFGWGIYEKWISSYYTRLLINNALQ